MKRSKEFEFFVKADLKKYEGKYVVIINDKVVASGDTAKVWEEVKRKFSDKKPLLAKVPKEEALVLNSICK